MSEEVITAECAHCGAPIMWVGFWTHSESKKNLDHYVTHPLSTPVITNSEGK
jgi:hypothetical protein